MATLGNSSQEADHDPYRRFAGFYDRLFEPMNKGLRLAGVRMFRPAKGMNILDVGCGTGAHLDLYRRYGCNLHGIDPSASMLEVARKRLGDAARLDLGSAVSMPYDDGVFHLVICMLTLHEMDPDTRLAVLEEMKRVLHRDGRLLAIDFHTGPYQPLQGWISKGIIFLSELAAGRRHYRNHRRFLRAGGLRPLLPARGLTVENEKVLAGGTFSLCLGRVPEPLAS